LAVHPDVFFVVYAGLPHGLIAFATLALMKRAGVVAIGAEISIPNDVEPPVARYARRSYLTVLSRYG